MKKSEKNLMILENFILYLTHCSDEREPCFKEPQTYTPEELYRVAYDYIEEDHVDGKENPDDDFDESKELALISSYIVGNDLLNGTVFQTFDEAYKIAEDFLIEYPLDFEWGVEKEWDETIEEFVNKRYINGKKLQTQ